MPIQPKTLKPTATPWVDAFAYPARLALLEPGRVGLFLLCPILGLTFNQTRNAFGALCKGWVGRSTDWYKAFGRGTPPDSCLLHRPHPFGLLVARRPLMLEPDLDFTRIPDYVWEYTEPPRRTPLEERLEERLAQRRKELGLT